MISLNKAYFNIPFLSKPILVRLTTTTTTTTTTPATMTKTTTTTLTTKTTTTSANVEGEHFQAIKQLKPLAKGKLSSNTALQQPTSLTTVKFKRLKS